MNREIKFRAWDKETDKMIFPDDNDCYFEITDAGLNLLDLTKEPNHLGSSYCDSVLMQYTGLKDMNGVEIYEGDFVRVTLRNYESFVSYVKWFGDEGYPAFDLHQVNEAFYFDSNILSTVMNDGSEVEVIGNIYENKNLLKEDTR